MKKMPVPMVEPTPTIVSENRPIVPFEVGLDVFLLSRNRFDPEQLLSQGGHRLLQASLSARYTASLRLYFRFDEFDRAEKMKS
ncbi:hypothetical protein [Brevibacterium epidermidis]|uniref:hypothetical protein n=1 Tax=Brevibacterium epidermidis TaxID=1698 RepID=UPI001F53A892|nr:hypothetical protein [Brevibacterium epidermidis]